VEVWLAKGHDGETEVACNTAYIQWSHGKAAARSGEMRPGTDAADDGAHIRDEMQEAHALLGELNHDG